MSNYVKATDFAAKDALLTGDPAKIVKGSEIDSEFIAIASAISTKADQSTTYTKVEVDAIETALEATIADSQGIVPILTSYDASTASGKVIKVSTGFTLNTGLAAGTLFTVYNDSASNITLTQGSGLTLRLTGTTITGNASVLPRGMVTVFALSTTEYVLSGAVT